MRWSSCGLGAGLSLFLLLPTIAAGKSKVENWNARIQETVGLLRSGNAPQARATIGVVLDEMAQSVAPGKKSGHAFGLALMLRALAEAGTGNEREATWDWHLAQQLDPPLESWDLREFGVAGEILDRHRLSRDPVPPAPKGDDLEKEGGQKPTVSKRQRQPSYVENARLRRWQGTLVIVVRVDANGLPTYPRLEQTSDELSMVLDTCEFARGLTFEPARRNGEPIAAMWDLTVNYRLQ